MHRWLLVAALAGGAFADPPKPPSTEEALVADPTTAKYAPVTTPGIPAGAQAALIGVDPNTKGPTAYARFPAKYRLPAHWHSHAEYAVLVSGAATFILDGKRYELVPGSYVVIPAKTPHELTCGAASECVLLSRRAGPTDYNFIKQ